MESTDELDDLETSSELHVNPYSMTEEELLKKSKKRNIRKLLVQSYVILTACISAISFGTTLGWPMSHSNVLKPSCSEQNWTWSLIPLGCCVGLSFSYYMVKTLGPKKTLLIDTPFYMLSYIGVAKGTVFCNLFIGICSMIYFTNAENLLVNAVHRTNLKHAVILLRTSRRVGILIAYLVGNVYGNFLLAVTCLAIPFVNALLLLILPESPRFLYNKSEKQCRESIQCYQGSENVYSTLLLIRTDYEESKHTFTYMLFSKTVFKAILVLVGLNFFRVCSGYYVHIFYRLPYHDKSLIVFSVFIDNLIFAINLVVSNFLGSCFHIFCKLGVRQSLFISSTLVTVTLIMQAIHMLSLRLQYKNDLFWNNSYIPVILQIMLVIAYEVGYSICADLLVFDYIPRQLHGVAKLVIYSLHWFCVYAVTKYFIISYEHELHHIPYFVLGVASFIGTIYCYYFIIEPRGKNFAQLQMELGGNPVGSRSNRKHNLFHLNSNV